MMMTVGMVVQVSSADGHQIFRLKLHWSQPRSNGHSIRGYVVQQQAVMVGAGHT
jgi:hypothetical protein